MTTDILLREDTGSFAPVRVIDPDQPVSAPYSRAVGLLDRWVRDSRHAVDEFAAWIEGQSAQAAAEMRALCDELELPVVWAELPDVQPVSLIPAEILFDKNNPHDRIGRGMGPALRARYGTVGGRSPFDTTPVPDENMPGRVAGTWVNLAEDDLMPGRAVRVGRTTLTPRDNPLAQAYAEREARGWTPVSPGRLVDDPMYARAFVPLPHKKPTKNRLAKRRLRRGLRHLGEHGPYNPVVRRIDGWLERADGWLRERFTPVKEER